MGGCSGPYSALDPAGPSAAGAAGLWWAMVGFATVTLIAVVSLWLYALRRRPRQWSQEQARRVHNRWIIGGGLVLPVTSITLLLAFGIPIGHRMLPLPLADSEVVRIDVTARQWWWDVSYPDSGIRLRDELHIPAGTPVDLHLTSDDVIHSFWVPRLGGKLDMLPGRTNVLRLQADEPGLYHGQCAEFCGIGHAHMKFTVRAHAPSEYAAWLEGATGDE
ncbi:cytochrome c oxidase subunit II [Halopseudomonas xiamenensis]|uniref:cytochrome c oxidase subunit II n=1 Tax=Halopseudomonas xiamenensis TaxID=157792 RepID=UPI001F165CE0|nr:cytochrome c oxidase subunit II [Halopseudomonas xiamenensis]